MSSEPEAATDGAVLAAEAAFERRLRQYLELGHDREAAVRWVVDTAGAIPGPVLDIGTGKGLLAVELACRGLEVTSVDPNAADQVLAARRASRRGCAERVRLVAGTVADLAAGPGSFGAAAMMNVLHHLDAVSPLFDRVGELVRVGGVFLVAEFTADGFEVVARAHLAEGSVHAVGPIDTRTARSALLDRGWTPLREATGHMHEVTVYRRE